MKFIISTQELNYLINKCQGVVSQRPTSPILGNILLEAKGGEVIITATDLTVGVRCFTEAKVLEEGITSLPAKRFASLVRELTATNIEISTDENDVTIISADSSRFKIHGMRHEEYPELPDLTDAIHVKFSQKQLKDMFFRTSFAVSREDNRYALTGVLLQVNQGKAIFAGTDGKRLARSYSDVEVDASFSGTYIVPNKAVDEFLKNLEEEGVATLHLMEDKVAIETETSIVITKLLSGEYPDINRIVPENVDNIVLLHREELMALLRQVSLFSGTEYQSVKFCLGEGELKLSANTMDVGEGKVSMPVDYHGPQLDIAFNPTFFIDILRHSRGETVTMGLTDSFNPGIITDNEEDVSSLPTAASSPLFVLMPMRLSE